MSTPQTLLESWSPVCDIQAFVEKSEANYYFYLWVNPHSKQPQMKSCWICNARPAPKQIDYKAMEQGMAPSMPEAYVSHNINGIELDAEKLSVEWFEEGDGAALLYENEIICVIPGWSGYNGFHGYSKYAIGTSPFAWEMTNAIETLSNRVNKSRAFWNFFETDYWEKVQQYHIDVLEKFFGKYDKYYAIDGGNFPPKALISGHKEDICYGITAGVSLIPMPCVEQNFSEDANNFRRMELGFAAIEKHKQLRDLMYSVLSGISALPWKEITFLAHGHTVPFQNIKGYAAILFLNPKLVPELESPDYEKFMEDDINLLWTVPITQEEYDFVLKHDVTELLNRANDVSRIHIFDGTKKTFDLV